MKVDLAFHSHSGNYCVQDNNFKNKYHFIFSAEDRCRHYMINQLKNLKYNVIGEAKVHQSLEKLIDYYRIVSFQSDFYFHSHLLFSSFAAWIVELEWSLNRSMQGGLVTIWSWFVNTSAECSEQSLFSSDEKYSKSNSCKSYQTTSLLDFVPT